MRRLLSACCGVLLLAGCATTPVSHEPLTASAQEQLLRDLPGFRFEGRAFITAGEGINPNLSWRQRGAESELRLTGMFGAGSLILRYSPDSLRVSTSRGEEFEGAEAARMLSEQLGFMPPFEALRYWVLGLSAPGEAPVGQVTDAAGRIAEMTQHEWHIRYDRWSELATQSGAVRLPRRMFATRAALQLRVVVERWTLQAAD